MKENSIEEDIKILKELGQKYYKNGEIKIKALSGAKYIWALQNLLSDYKRVLKENEHKTEKIENQKNELAILNNKQKDLKKLQNTLNSYRGQFKRQKKEIKEKDELIEKMKNYLLKENKMCDFLECEEK